MTTDDYKKLFPGAPIMALSDIKNTTKNSGKHMKQEKYKKMFSEKVRGEKNPNHYSSVSQEMFIYLYEKLKVNKKSLFC